MKVSFRCLVSPCGHRCNMDPNDPKSWCSDSAISIGNVTGSKTKGGVPCLEHQQTLQKNQTSLRYVTLNQTGLFAPVLLSIILYQTSTGVAKCRKIANAPARPRRKPGSKCRLLPGLTSIAFKCFFWNSFWSTKLSGWAQTWPFEDTRKPTPTKKIIKHGILKMFSKIHPSQKEVQMHGRARHRRSSAKSSIKFLLFRIGLIGINEELLV